jgi:hypothetical protein
MNPIKRLRGAPIIALVALGVLGLPATASAGKSHLIKLYKVEQHVDVEGDAAYDISCQGTDIATDGMWRVDDVSQDNEFDLLTQYTQTVATKAAATGLSSYQFKFLPIAGGDVQVKLWITCLENPVGSSPTHQHSWTTQLVSATQAPVTAPSGSVPFVVGPASGNGNGTANDCKGGFVPIQPSFDFSTKGGYGYLQRSWNASTGSGDVGWSWRFNVVQAGLVVNNDEFQVSLSYRCLKLKGSASGSPSHAHRLVQQYKTKLAQNQTARTFRTHQVDCGEHYKGMVGAWDSSDNSLYYLGMDPRIKARAFKFVNTDTADHTVDLRLSCFKDRTT